VGAAVTVGNSGVGVAVGVGVSVVNGTATAFRSGQGVGVLTKSAGSSLYSAEIWAKDVATNNKQMIKLKNAL